MQTYLAIMSTLATLALGALVTFNLAPSTSRTRWEYKIETPLDILFDREMSNLGGEGWEVVTCRRAVDSITDKAGYECIFKRPT